MHPPSVMLVHPIEGKGQVYSAPSPYFTPSAMEDFPMPSPCAIPCASISRPPTSRPPSLKMWVEKELRCLTFGSASLDRGIVKVAKDIVGGTASEENVLALERTISWRRQKQTEICALAYSLAIQNIVPASVFVSPILLPPVSVASYKNRMLLIELVPELSVFTVPPEGGDNLRTVVPAPLYWLATLLTRAREARPETCSLERAVAALVDLGVAKVPEGKTKEGHVRELTCNRELEAGTLFLGMDDIARELCRSKPFFGWTLAPYDK